MKQMCFHFFLLFFSILSVFFPLFAITHYIKFLNNCLSYPLKTVFTRISGTSISGASCVGMLSSRGLNYWGG